MIEYTFECLLVVVLRALVEIFDEQAELAFIYVLKNRGLSGTSSWSNRVPRHLSKAVQSRHSKQKSIEVRSCIQKGRSRGERVSQRTMVVIRGAWEGEAVIGNGRTTRATVHG